MERLSTILDEINTRMTHGENTAKIVPISKESGIYLHEKFLESWNTIKTLNTDTVLTNHEQNVLIDQSRMAYEECAKKVQSKEISLESADVIEPLLKSEDRRLLGNRIGLCYDWSFVLNLAERGRNNDVTQICTRDLFLIKTIGYWCYVNRAYKDQASEPLMTQYVPLMKTIFNGIKQVEDVKELKFPEISKTTDFIGIGKVGILGLVEKDLNKINKVVLNSKVRSF